MSITLTIDGKKIIAEEGMTILNVASQNGIKIPNASIKITGPVLTFSVAPDKNFSYNDEPKYANDIPK